MDSDGKVHVEPASLHRCFIFNQSLTLCVHNPLKNCWKVLRSYQRVERVVTVCSVAFHCKPRMHQTNVVADAVSDVDVCLVDELPDSNYSSSHSWDLHVIQDT